MTFPLSGERKMIDFKREISMALHQSPRIREMTNSFLFTEPKGDLGNLVTDLDLLDYVLPPDPQDHTGRQKRALRETLTSIYEDCFGMTRTEATSYLNKVAADYTQRLSEAGISTFEDAIPIYTAICAREYSIYKNCVEAASRPEDRRDASNMMRIYAARYSRLVDVKKQMKTLTA
jgi:hypothetical protein